MIEELERTQIFHVHTYRCGHAQDISDAEYIKRAIELGSRCITFTDHAPFPGNPFRNRMLYEQLDEYIATLKELKEIYRPQILVKIGLEIEYLPSFGRYYEELKSNDDIDVLLLGQHHAETKSGIYTFEMADKSDEWKYLMDAQVAGTETELFDAVAHPDRLFKREKIWTEEMTDKSTDFINVVRTKNTTIEKNYSSLKRKGQYWDEFWELVSKDHPIIYGCDAHFINQLMLNDKGIFECQKKASSIIPVADLPPYA